MLRRVRCIPISALAACGLALSACGGSDAPSSAPAGQSSAPTRPSSHPTRPANPGQADAPRPRAEVTADAPPSHCPPELSNCSTASGRIIYIEAVDPDGDGDAHFILASTDSITAPGLSIIDISKDLRPNRLPPLGTSVSAAGPVYPGHLGQHQIQAFELHIAGRKP